MSRATGPIAKEEILEKGRRPVGRTVERDSNGRHGQKMPGTVSEEGAAQPEGRKVHPVGVAAFVLAAAVGLAVACSEGGGLKDQPDAGWDTDTETDTGSEADAGTDSGTGPLGPACEHHAGPSYDYEAKLAVGDNARLTVEGHHMEVVALDLGNQLAEVHITDGEGNPIMNGDSYFVFDGMDSTLTVELGDETITLTLCWVFEVPVEEDPGREELVPGLYAKFISDSENGFVHCEEAEPYTSTESEYVVDEDTTQTITRVFQNEGETGDEECGEVTTEFYMEHSEFDAPLPTQHNLPGGEDKSVKVRGTPLKLLDVGMKDGVFEVRLGKELASGNLQEDESVTGEDLEVEYKGPGTYYGADFSFKYPGIDEDTDLWVEDTGENEKTIYVQTSSDLLVFTLRFSNLNLDGSIDVSLLKDVQSMEPFAVFTVGGEDYEAAVSYTTENDAVTGWFLYPAD